MKTIHVIRNRAGGLVASFEPATGNGPSLTPVLQPGERLDTIEVAENYHLDVAKFYAQTA